MSDTNTPVEPPSTPVHVHLDWLETGYPATPAPVGQGPVASDIVGPPCQACGHPTSPHDPPARIRGFLIHARHLADPSSGLYRGTPDPEEQQ